MDRDTFIIMVYCLVVTEYRRLRASANIRRGGFLPALTDEEVITIEICGEYLKHTADKDLFAYFYKHYRRFFFNSAAAISCAPTSNVEPWGRVMPE